MTLTCTVEDFITHEVKSASRSLSVYLTPLMFEDIREQLSSTVGRDCTMTANVFCYNTQSVQFRMWSYGVGNSSVYCFIIRENGSRETIYWGPPSENISILYPEFEMTTKTVELGPGLNKIEMHFPHGLENQVELYMNTLYPELNNRVVNGRYMWFGKNLRHLFMY